MSSALRVPAVATGDGVIYRCHGHAGMVDMSIPIFVEGEHAATVTCGQSLPETASDESFAAIWRRVADLGINRSRLRRAYDKAQSVEPDKLQAVLSMLKMFTEYLCALGRRLRQLGEQRRRDHRCRIRSSRTAPPFRRVSSESGPTPAEASPETPVIRCLPRPRRPVHP